MEINQSAAGGPIPKLFKYDNLAKSVFLLNLTAPSQDDNLYHALEFLRETLLRAKHAEQAEDTKKELEEVTNAVTAARSALDRAEELGLKEPQRLVQIFRNLVNRRNELDPDLSQAPHL